MLENVSIQIWPLISQKRRSYPWKTSSVTENTLKILCLWGNITMQREDEEVALRNTWIFYHLLYRYHSKSLFTCHLLSKWKISLPLISGCYIKLCHHINYKETYMNWLNMSLQMTYCCCFIFTLITRVVLHMLWHSMCC